jgi:hypothetical protein
MPATSPAPTRSAGLHLYPDVPERRRSRMLRDAAVLAMLVFLVWMGRQVYVRVDSISVVASGVTTAGESVQGGFSDVADAVSGIPVVGGRLSDALSSSGSATGGNVASLGKQGEDAIHRTALLVGFLTFLIPALLLLGLTLPGRIRGIREMAEARQLLVDDGNPERARLMALRAAMSLPVDHLLEYTEDPIGDLMAGRHDRLIDALYAESGLLRRAPTA